MYPLFIDDRAGSKDLMRWLCDDTTELTRLDFGDAMVIGNGPEALVTIGVEVKSVTDLLQSASTGRLAGHQLPGLLAGHDLSWLLTYGPYRPGPGGVLQVLSGKGGWRSYKIGPRLIPYTYIEGFLFDVVATGCRHKHVYNAEEAAYWLKTLHRWWSKRWVEHKGLKQFDKSKDLSLLPGMDAQTAQVARTAATLPGIGFDRACAVANHFATIESMVYATVDEWQAVPGVGKVIAQAVHRAIRNT